MQIISTIVICKGSVIKIRAIALLLSKQEIKLGNPPSLSSYYRPEAKDRYAKQCFRIQACKSRN